MTPELEELKKLLAEAEIESGEPFVLRLFKPDPAGDAGWLQYAHAGGWRNLWDAEVGQPGTISFTDAAIIVAAVNALQVLVERVEKAEAENKKLKAALEPDMFWDQDNPEQPYYDIEELLREQDYDRDRDIILDTQEAIRCADGSYFCRINSPSEDSETDDAEVIIRKLTDDERKQWRAVYRVWLSMQYLKPLFARAALRSEP